MRGKRRRRVLTGLAVVLLVFCAATARLFIWPAAGMPARASAIVMLDAPGDFQTVGVALRLAREHRAPYLVISLGTPGSGFNCPRPVPKVRLICFFPSPVTTQGEAEFVGQLARKYHWRSIVIVTITPQGTRARVRVERCFDGPVYVVTAPIKPDRWPYEIAYEWGALLKALVLQRSC